MASQIRLSTRKLAHNDTLVAYSRFLVFVDIFATSFIFVDV